MFFFFIFYGEGILCVFIVIFYLFFVELQESIFIFEIEGYLGVYDREHLVCNLHQMARLPLDIQADILLCLCL